MKSKGLRQFKRLKTPMMSAGTKERRTTRAGLLAERFGKNRMIEKCVFQDEKDFTLDIPINHQNSRVYGSNLTCNPRKNRLQMSYLVLIWS